MPDNKEEKEYDSTLVESLRLIVQSQLVLTDLQNNQRRLETLITELEAEDGKR